MKSDFFLRRSLFLLLFICSLFFSATQNAHADSDFFEKTVWVLEKTKVFPTDKIQAFNQSRTLVDCLVGADNDLQVIACVDTYKETDIGKEVAKEGGLPSWLWDLVDLYVDIRTGDFWGAVEHLGKAAICIIAQVITGGADICSLVEELIKMGEALLDAAVAVAEFLADLGGAVVGAVNSIGCSLGLGGCDDTPPPPPEVLAYQWIYHPKIMEGVQALKQTSSVAYYNFKKQLRDNALHRPYAIYSVPIQTTSIMGMTIEIPPKMAFNEPPINIAEQLYAKTTDANWTSEIINNTLPDLSIKRNSYTNTTQMHNLAYVALMKYNSELQGSNKEYTKNHIDTLVRQYVAEQCETEFNQTYGFAHFDRWLSNHTKEAKDLKNPLSSKNWCSKLIDNNKLDFIPKFRQYLQTKGCSVIGQKLVCGSLDSYSSCLKLMGTAANADECKANTVSAGPEAAKQIINKLIANGSNLQLYPCTITAPPAPVSLLPARLTCGRPAQTFHCNEINKELFSSYPQIFVSCQLQESAQYKTLHDAVDNARKLLTSGPYSYGLPQLQSDPMISDAGSLMALDSFRSNPANQTFNFPPPSSNKGFEYKQVWEGHKWAYDGENNPKVVYYMPKQDPKGNIAVNPVKDKLLNPGNPLINPDPNQNINKGMAANPAMSANLANKAALTGSAPALGSSQAQGKQQVMSGSLPDGGQNITPPTGGSTYQPLAVNKPTVKPSIKPLPAPAKPDLIPAGQLTFAGISTQWGGTVTLNGQQTQPAANGLCSASVTYSVQNTGTAPATAFTSMLLSSAIPNQSIKQWSNLAPGRSQSQTDQVLLRPGQNSLTLYLDHTNQTNELNETNNQVRLQVILNGSCQPQQLPLMRQTPQRQAPIQPGLYR